MAESTGRRVRYWLGALAGAVLDWLYPRHCYQCEQPIIDSRSHALCRACYREFVASRIGPSVCACCGLPFETAVEDDAQCVGCRLQERHFDAARALFAYVGPGASLIKSFKFHGDYFLGPRLLAALLREGWMPPGIKRPDAVLPIPLHPRRRRERGYDQAVLLARVVARHFDCELLRSALVRTRYTSQQALLPVSKRWDNVRRAFTVARTHEVAGRALLVVDDVLTTGVTAGECARALKRAGATRVQVLTLARALP